MFLRDIQLIPGKIISVVDINKGSVRCTAPGLFSVDDDPELLPPIYPFVENQSYSFSSPLIGDEVWIISNNNNNQVLFYLRRKQIPDHVSELLGDSNVEVVLSRDTDNGLYQFYMSDGTGLKLLKDDSYICIDSEDNITITTGDSHRTISIDSSGISLGTKGGSAEPALLGDKTMDVFNTIYNIFMLINVVTTPNPYTSPISSAISNSLTTLKSQIEQIQSENVTLD